MFDRPLPVLPADLRRAVECRVMVLLARDLALDIHWQAASGYVAPSRGEQDASDLIARVTAPSRSGRGQGPRK
jgi:hypothetical protein